MEINGLPLPRLLVAQMTDGRWRPLATPAGLDRLFPERGEFYPYSADEMRSETEAVSAAGGPMWLGTPDAAAPPGDLDLGLAILIADLGLGYDQPVALDYRLSAERPRVLTLRWGYPPGLPTNERRGRWGEGNRWVEIAPDFEMFVTLISI